MCILNCYNYYEVVFYYGIFIMKWYFIMMYLLWRGILLWYTYYEVVFYYEVEIGYVIFIIKFYSVIDNVICYLLGSGNLLCCV